MTSHLHYSGKRVLVLGMGLSGRSAAEFLIAQGASVHGIDRDSHLLNTHAEIQSLKQAGLTVYSENEFQNLSSDNLSGFDFLVISPGVPSSHPHIFAAEKAKIACIGEIELGSRSVKNPIIGITGTNGKTTVTLLVEHILNQSGQQAKALGNVGIPFTKELLCIDPATSIVLELSSYQIETLSHLFLEGGLILNITPDHLDRYPNMEAYAHVKCSLENALKINSPLYMHEEAWHAFGSLLKKAKPRLYGYLEKNYLYTDLNSVYREGKFAFELPAPLKNKRSHDLENLLAAYALCSDRGVSSDSFLTGWRTFKKPAHRIEFVREYCGVSYYDDSKGTNVDAVIRAVESIQGAIVLIAGGVDKGGSYLPWIERFGNKVKLICAIGQAAGKIDAQLGSRIPVVIFNSLDEAVQEATLIAQKGESVLLSPGCSSFDMFRDYAHRGDEFKRIVRELRACSTIMSRL